MLRIKSESTLKITVSCNYLPETRKYLSDTIQDKLRKCLSEEDYLKVSIRRVKVDNSPTTGRIYVEVSSTLARVNMIQKAVEEAIKQTVEQNYRNEIETNPLMKGKVNIL